MNPQSDPARQEPSGPFVAANQPRIQTEVELLRGEIEQLRKERALMLRSLEFHERDRQLLAFEIHDGIVQDMTGGLMFLESAAAGATFADPKLYATNEKGLRLLRGSITEARRLMGGLIPLVLDDRGLVASLIVLLERFRKDHGLAIEFHHDVQFAHLTPAVAMIVLRIVQESLNNVVRHSQVTSARVAVVQQGDRLEVSVHDQGVGFDPDKVEKTRYGLTGVRERARLFGGQAEIESAPGQGAMIRVHLPLADAILPREFHE